jgi:Uma2 family endonuclease
MAFAYSTDMNDLVRSKPEARELFNAGTAPLRRFTVDEYHAMGSAGVLEDDRVELLDGLIVMMSPIGPPHAYSMRRANRLLESVLPDDWDVRQQLPITLPRSEPQPDLAVVRGTMATYARRHPGPGDIGLLIEVSDTTLLVDRRKALLYAAALVPQYWIINLGARQLEVYTDPRQTRKNIAAKYRSQHKYGDGEKVKLVLGRRAIATISVRDLLP